MRLLRLVSAAALAAIALATASACQVALRAEGEDARCEPDGLSCGNGLTCQGGYCRPCVPKPEECNLKDDDCDGLVDEDFDKDGDTFKECGAAGQVDCNDDPERGGRDVYPGAPEKCNGIDDNCNGQTDESPNDCGPDQECWSAKGRCTIKGDCRIHGCEEGRGCNSTTGQCTEQDCRKRPPPQCPTGQACDAKSGICQKVTEIGDPCDGSVVCKDSSCIDLTEIGVPGRSGQICTRACCDSTQCPDGFVCRQGDKGAAVCIKTTDLVITTGPLLANAKCANGSECRSGICTGGFCVDGCCASPTCGTGGTCSIKSDNKFLCRSALGTRTPGQSCDGDSQCTTGICYRFLFGGGLCTKKCCSSADCSNGWKCQTFTAGGSFFTACAPMSWSETQGTKIGGENCTNDGECRSARCLDGYCSDSCCVDAECGGGAVCRPRKLSGGAVMNRCMKSI